MSPFYYCSIHRNPVFYGQSVLVADKTRHKLPDARQLERGPILGDTNEYGLHVNHEATFSQPPITLSNVILACSPPPPEHYHAIVFCEWMIITPLYGLCNRIQWLIQCNYWSLARIQILLCILYQHEHCRSFLM